MGLRGHPARESGRTRAWAGPLPRRRPECLRRNLSGRARVWRIAGRNRLPDRRRGRCRAPSGSYRAPRRPALLRSPTSHVPGWSPPELRALRVPGICSLSPRRMPRQKCRDAYRPPAERGGRAPLHLLSWTAFLAPMIRRIRAVPRSRAPHPGTRLRRPQNLFSRRQACAAPRGHRKLPAHPPRPPAAGRLRPARPIRTRHRASLRPRDRSPLRRYAPPLEPPIVRTTGRSSGRGRSSMDRNPKCSRNCPVVP